MAIKSEHFLLIMIGYTDKNTGAVLLGLLAELAHSLVTKPPEEESEEELCEDEDGDISPSQLEKKAK